MPHFTAAVRRHRQDDGFSCGRACAQMLIAHVAQAAAARGDAVIVTQLKLKSLEQDPVDVDHKWSTHPDELHKLLDQAPQLQGSGLTWNVVASDKLKAVKTLMLEALVNGLPSAITTGETDHWIVLVGAEVSAGDDLQYLEFLDPQPVIGQVTAHTIGDDCGSGFNGQTYVPEQVKEGQFGAFDFRIGSAPTPAGLTNYTDKFVAVVCGALPAQPEMAAAPENGGAENGGSGPDDENASQPLNVERWLDRGEPPIMTGSLVGAFKAVAERWQLGPLQTLIQSTPTDVVRQVRNIDLETEHYNLFTLSSPNVPHGLIGTMAPDGSLLHFQFTTNARLLSSIRAVPPGEHLWWSRRRTRTLLSPYYPLRRFLHPGDANPRFIRLFDEVEISPDTPGANR